MPRRDQEIPAPSLNSIEKTDKVARSVVRVQNSFQNCSLLPLTVHPSSNFRKIYSKVAPKKVDMTTTAPQTIGAKDHSGAITETPALPVAVDEPPPELPVAVACPLP